jgi:RNA polymerase sigma factor (sigma-70 family)
LQKAPQRAASAEDEGIAWMERSAVIEALRALPRRQREAVVLRYYGDLSDAQVAAAMGVSTGAAQRHAARAMAPMRAVLSRHDDDRAVEEHHYAPADSRTTQPPAPSA